MVRILAAASVALPALLAPAIVAGTHLESPFPETLSAAEVDAARAALNPGWRNQPEPQLVRSGKGGAGPVEAFASFAWPPVQASQRTTVRKLVTCEYAAAAWRCSGAQFDTRAMVNGVEHAFPLWVRPAASEDPQAMGEIVDFLFSPCLGAQHATLTQEPFEPLSASHPISSIYLGPSRFELRAAARGSEDFYVVEKDEAKTQGCSYKVILYRSAREQLLAQQKIQQDAERLAAERRTREEAAGPLWLAGLACCLLAVCVPWGMVAERAAARTGDTKDAWQLTGAACVLGAMGVGLFWFASANASGNIRVDLLISIPLVLLTSVRCAGLALHTLRLMQPATGVWQGLQILVYLAGFALLAGIAILLFK